MRDRQVAYFQWLRIFAAFAVVLMHTAAKRWMSVSHETDAWLTLTAWDSLVRWPVPVFIMITGAIFLPRKTELRTVLTRYIPRVLAAWLIWSGIHAAYAYHQGTPLREALVLFARGHYHLWYLPFLAGVYLTLPFLQRIAEDDRLTKQLLAVSSVVGLLIPWLADLAALLIPEMDQLMPILKNHLHYTFFFDLLAVLLLGHVLHRTDLSSRARNRIYAAGVLGPIVTFTATVWISRHLGNHSALFFEHSAPANLCTAAALFVFAKYNLTRLPRAVARMAKYSFGVYLCHAFLIDLLADRGIHVLTWDPMWSVPVLSVGIFAAALILTAVISKIPVIGKYLT